MDTIIRGWIADILKQHESLLAIAVRQRAKFEGWLKFELAAHAERQGAASVQVEATYTDPAAGQARSDLAFDFDGLHYDIELKTPNTNWRLPGVQSKIRPITQNINEIIQDGRKLAYCTGHGIIAIVLFPLSAHNQEWTLYLDRIAAGLGVSLSVQDHTSRLTVPLGGGITADVIICCFPISRLLSQKMEEYPKVSIV